MSSEYDDPPANAPAGPSRGEAADPIAQQLLSQAQAIARLRADLDDLAQHSTDTLVDLVERVENLESSTDGAGGTPAAWCWRDLAPQATAELRHQLTSWVDWLRGRYPLARKIPDCWAQHPETVEELTALWLAWQAAYTEPNPALTAAADWHDRWLPGALYRLEHGPFALDCGSGHRDRPATAYATSTADAENSTGREQDARAGPSQNPSTVDSPHARAVVHNQPAPRRR